ncbi:MAG: hypothetical protein OEY55_02040, partial [Acidimicrobiia bacterium]|nr:hypothetical protein [Acidimicrobiia bacterium]
MRRSLIVGVLVVVVLLEGAARLLAPHIPGQLVWDTQFTQDKADQIAAADLVDVVYVGSSVVNAGIDPGLVSANSRFDSGYNAAIPSTTPSTWKIWMRDLVFPDLCPSVVVIGISVRDYNDGNVGIPFDLRSYLPSAGRLELYGQFTSASLEQQIGRYSAFVRIRSRLRQPEKVARFLMLGRVPGWPATVLTPDGRYTGWDDNEFVDPSPEGIEQLTTKVFVNFSVGGPEDLAVRAIIEDAQALGGRVVIVRMPTMNELIAPLLPSGQDDLDKFERQVEKLGEDYDLPVIVYPDMDDNATLFGDLYHMNLAGTTEFSTR